MVKRFLIRDPAGRPLSVQSERVTDDGNGTVQSTTQQTAVFCTGCRRPVTDLSEMRGNCDWCGSRHCCIHCVDNCEVCHRKLCGGCRRGFAGPPLVTVCATCQQKLVQRQVLQDQQLDFQRTIVRHRMYHQDQALRLTEERQQLAAQLQIVRLGLTKTTKLQRLMRTIGWIFWAFLQVIRYAFYPLCRPAPTRRL